MLQLYQISCFASLLPYRLKITAINSNDFWISKIILVNFNINNFGEELENRLLRRKDKLNSNLRLKLFVQRPVTQCNTDTGRHSMEKTIVDLSRVNCESRAYIFRNHRSNAKISMTVSYTSFENFLRFRLVP
jgi:hypothetical protein